MCSVLVVTIITGVVYEARIGGHREPITDVHRATLHGYSSTAEDRSRISVGKSERLRFFLAKVDMISQSK